MPDQSEEFGASKLRPTISRKRLNALMNPRTRHLLDSRLVRAEWLMGERWDPWLSLRIYRLGGFTAHLEVGRLYVRWAPIKRADWRRMKQEGKRGRKFRNAAQLALSGSSGGEG